LREEEALNAGENKFSTLDATSSRNALKEQKMKFDVRPAFVVIVSMKHLT
jgi:hypothetical protein